MENLWKPVTTLQPQIPYDWWPVPYYFDTFLDFIFQIHLAYAELFVINENGMVVGFEHCKSKSFDDVQPALKRIWNAQGPQVVTQVVWTDNVQSDKRGIQTTYHNIKPGCTVDVGQVGHCISCCITSHGKLFDSCCSIKLCMVRKLTITFYFQDSFHVCDRRIIRECSRKHADYHNFRRLMKSGFRKFHTGG